MIELLQTHGVDLLADIRTVPKSRTNPQFNKDNLTEQLPERGIAYEHITDLGGLRQTTPDSKNTVWENESFRGYADYMETDQFRHAVDRLIEQAKRHHMAIMCAEAVWWRCHRGMVSDELVARGVRVEHIMNDAPAKAHSLRSFAKVVNGHVSYR